MSAYVYSTDTLPQPAEQPAEEPRQARQAVVLVGSAKPRGRSSSELLGRALLDRLAPHGVSGVVWHAHAASGDPKHAFDVLAGCDLLVLATPLYFDALPAHLVALLQRIAEHRRASTRAEPMALAALVNCGTPDARQADTALAMCALVAREARLEWRGGLAFGQGEAINGQHPQRQGAVPCMDALDAAARALAAGLPVPDDARALAARPIMPESRYALLGNAGWLFKARRAGNLLRIGARPMEK